MSSIFPIGDLDDLLIKKVFTKMSPKDFVRFQRTNKKIYSLCNSKENVFCLSLARIQVESDSEFSPDIDATLFMGPGMFSGRDINLNLMEDVPFSIKCKQLSLKELIKNNQKFIDECLKIIRQRQIICDRFCYSGDFTGRETELKLCIKATRPVEIEFTGFEEDPDEFEGYRGFLPSHHFPMSLFKDMKAFHIDKSDYVDKDLILLKAENIYMHRSNLTSWGVNQLIQQWFSNEREIVDVHLEYLGSLSEDEVIKDLPVCLIYNKNWHQYSLASHVDISQIPDIVPSKYQLIRPGCFDGMLRLDIYNSPNLNYIRIRPRGFITDYEVDRFAHVI